ncbi:predicted protein [Sclerotinia sclerotiorum 1980 UF-70]|uniref:Uncharacterized protein n=1 Tax=Sclerotinia sclerotiorum (strain ATCC 18683 / 1980 / Ss-1) TaxID=665079 RepID=A7F3U7_SCLS1|nr:predicted protein [Sclerotinia sclerotiorum 1980 UF-70]EDN97418.1 predicted protein [Sclerotinia sclerotiorum 1980 UF-70]
MPITAKCLYEGLSGVWGEEEEEEEEDDDDDDEDINDERVRFHEVTGVRFFFDFGGNVRV